MLLNVRGRLRDEREREREREREKETASWRTIRRRLKEKLWERKEEFVQYTRFEFIARVISIHKRWVTPRPAPFSASKGIRLSWVGRVGLGGHLVWLFGATSAPFREVVALPAMQEGREFQEEGWWLIFLGQRIMKPWRWEYADTNPLDQSPGASWTTKVESQPRGSFSKECTLEVGTTAWPTLMPTLHFSKVFFKS